MGESHVVNLPPDSVLYWAGVITFTGFTLMLLCVKPIRKALRTYKRKWIAEHQQIYPKDGFGHYYGKILEPWVKLFDWIAFWFLVIGAINEAGHMYRCTVKVDIQGLYEALGFIVLYLFFTLILVLAEICGLPYQKYRLFMEIERFLIRPRR